MTDIGTFHPGPRAGSKSTPAAARPDSAMSAVLRGAAGHTLDHIIKAGLLCGAGEHERYLAEHIDLQAE